MMEKSCQNCGLWISKPSKISIKQWNRKKFCSRQCQDMGRDKTNIGGKNKGVAHPWKENKVTPLQEQIRRCFEYRQWRCDVFTRDDWTCQLCGQRGGKLVADHIESFRDIFYLEKIKTLQEAVDCSRLWDINNGRTLCKLCHLKTDNYGHKAKSN